MEINIHLGPDKLFVFDTLEWIIREKIMVQCTLITNEGEDHTANGSIFLTTGRLAFISVEEVWLRSFSIPLLKIRGLNYRKLLFRDGLMQFSCMTVDNNNVQIEVKIDKQDKGEFVSLLNSCINYHASISLPSFGVSATVRSSLWPSHNEAISPF